MRVCIIKSAEFIGWKRSGSKVKKMIYGSIEYVLKLSPFIWDFLQVISDRDDVACRCAPPLPFVTARAPNQCWCYTSQASFDSRWHANANRPKSASSRENSRGKPAPIDRYNKTETFRRIKNKKTRTVEIKRAKRFLNFRAPKIDTILVHFWCENVDGIDREIFVRNVICQDNFISWTAMATFLKKPNFPPKTLEAVRSSLKATCIFGFEIHGIHYACNDWKKVERF